MAFFLEQRMLAKHGADYELARAIATVGLLVACSDRTLDDAELQTVVEVLPDLAESMGVTLAPLDRPVVDMIGKILALRVAEEGEGLVFDTTRPLLDETSGAVAVVLAAKVAAADGEVDEDELALLRPIAKQLGFDEEEIEDLIEESYESASGATLH